MSVPNLSSPIKVTVVSSDDWEDSQKLCNNTCLVNCCGNATVSQELSDDHTTQKVAHISKKTLEKGEDKGCCVIL